MATSATERLPDDELKKLLQQMGLEVPEDYENPTDPQLDYEGAMDQVASDLPSQTPPGHQGETIDSKIANASMDDDDLLDDDMRLAAMQAMYGASFPGLMEAEGQKVEEADWVRWGTQLWTGMGAGIRKRIHLTERNRLFRANDQWVSSIGMGPWVEPPKPYDAARVVYNVIDKALDQRLQIVTEQRPGFKTRPISQDPDKIKKAEAQQLALEYHYDEQRMDLVVKEAEYWAQTDGVSFLCVYWDPDAGPWNETLLAVKGPNGQRMQKKVSLPLGDVRTCVYRIEQVRVSPNARSTEEPYFWVIREVLPRGAAVAQYGAKAALPRDPSSSLSSGEGLEMTGLRPLRGGMEVPGISELLVDQDTVSRITVFAEKSEFLPNGLTLVVVGDRVVYQGDLLCGVVPMVRFTDGSSDPAFFCQPVMEGWIDQQMRINAILSKWVESVRLNAGGRFIAKKDSVVAETLLGGVMSLIEINSGAPIGEVIQPMQGFSIGQDVKELLQLEMKAFQDASGWNDTSRGSFSADQSGRAILAQREALERIFAPPVNAAAEALTRWAKITLHWMRWGYDLPRTINAMGKGRPDLGHALTADDFQGVCDVEIDAETLMPMPRALRLFLLDQMFEKGIMTPQEYRRRVPFAWTQNLETPDTDHEARAQRIAEAIRQMVPNVPPMLWMDNEAIHQDVLEREILLDDDLPDPVRQVAFERWMQLAQQAQIKTMGAPPQAPTPAPHPKRGKRPGGKPKKGLNMSPRTQPLAGTRPGVAAAPLSLTSGSDQQSAGKSFDRLSAT